MKLIRKSLQLIILVIALISCSKEEKKSPPAPIKVDVLKIIKSNHFRSLTYSGTIEPENITQIGFSVSGVVDNIAVEEGQSVKKGQLLASIDATEYSGALAIANAGLEQAEDLYTRLNGLYEKGSLPAKDYIEIKTRVAQAKANKVINEKHIHDSRLYAPITGIITSKTIEQGSAAAPGVPAFTIVKTDIVYARIAVPESEVGMLRNGMATHVFIPTLSDTMKGVITIINPLADAVSKTYSVKIKLVNVSGRLLPGMLGVIKINTSKRTDVTTVPATAVVRDADDITYLFVCSNKNRAVRRRIVVEGVTGENQLIVRGLDEGEQVIIAGQSRLKEGSALAF